MPKMEASARQADSKSTVITGWRLRDGFWILTGRSS